MKTSPALIFVLSVLYWLGHATADFSLNTQLSTFDTLREGSCGSWLCLPCQNSKNVCCPNKFLYPACCNSASSQNCSTTVAYDAATNRFYSTGNQQLTRHERRYTAFAKLRKLEPGAQGLGKLKIILRKEHPESYEIRLFDVRPGSYKVMYGQERRCGHQGQNSTLLTTSPVMVDERRRRQITRLTVKSLDDLRDQPVTLTLLSTPDDPSPGLPVACGVFIVQHLPNLIVKAN